MLKHWTANNNDFLNDLKWSNFFEKDSANSTANNVSDENNNDPNEQNEKKNVDDEINHLFNNILFIESSFPSIYIDIMFSFDDQSFHDQNTFILLLLFFQFLLLLLMTELLKTNHLILLFVRITNDWIPLNNEIFTWSKCLKH